MRGESRYKLWLPLVMVSVLIAAAVVFWAARSEIQDQGPDSEREFDVPRAVPRQLTSWEPPAKWLPEVESVPANALKFYLLFASAMTEGDIFTRLKLERRTDVGWQPVEGAFRESELWSPDGKRLTVWLHPGRQKMGVNLNEDEGPVLEEGGQYQLVLRGDATSREGHPLGSEVVLGFRATAADHSCPDPKEWQWEFARGLTSTSPIRFELSFPKPLDVAMLSSAFQADGKPLPVGVDDSGQAVWFYASEAWAKIGHVIEVNPKLEDMAGNNLLGPFEVDVTKPAHAPSPKSFQVPLQPWE